MRKMTRGFTLIELLVVIAIVALLMSIVIPAIQLVKRKAATAVCASNARQISVCWFMYQEDNSGRICSSNPGNKYGWVKNPQDENGVARSYSSTLEVTDADEIRGIEEGVLFPYYDSPELLHCVADRIRKSKFDQTKIYRSYSIPQCLNSGESEYEIENATKISSPGLRIMLVEEADYRNYNVGSWSFGAPEWSKSDNGYRWWDPMAVLHGDSSILAFCDGHAEVHKWRVPSTKKRILDFAADPTRLYFDLDPSPPSDGTEDVDYVGAGWAYRSGKARK